jgi:ABC-2 type transport system permease protein
MTLTETSVRAGRTSRTVRRAAWGGSSRGIQVLVLTTRSLKALVLDPRLLVASLLGPLLMLVVFSQVFGSIAGAPGFPGGIRYIDFLVPAIMVNTAMQSALHTGMGLVQDARDGIISRFRSLPIWLGSVLVARSLVELVRSGMQLLVVVCAAAMLAGFRPAGGLPGVAGAWGLALVVGGGLGWILIALACWLRDVELMQNVAAVVMLPLMFASSAFVPVHALPAWLRLVAQVNPMTYGIDAARNLTLGHPVGASAPLAVALSLTVVAMTAPVAIRGFRRPM